jgi:hypothetical protein
LQTWDDGLIRDTDTPPLNSNGDVPAWTTQGAGIIYILSTGSFFTGKGQNGGILQGAFQGLSLTEIQGAMIIHEFLHFEGVIGDDNGGQQYTFPNGDTVQGSDGISKEVVKKCLKD